jgi:ABC-type multidrug transport system fused ATPase/permease subunit
MNDQIKNLKVFGSLTEIINKQITYLCVLGVAAMIFNYLKVSFWLIPAERQAKKMRQSLFKSILRQDISWFDTYKVGELTNRLTE